MGDVGNCISYLYKKEHSWRLPEYKEEKKMKKVVTVDGMMCMHCVAHVKDALSKVEGVSDVLVSLDEKTAILNCTENVTDQMLSDAVTNAGYTVISVK